MLPNELEDHVRGRLELEFGDRRSVVLEAKSHVVVRAAATGNLGSGRLFIQMGEIVSQELRVRVRRAYQVLTSAATAFAVAPYPGLASDSAALIEEICNKQLTDLEPLLVPTGNTVGSEFQDVLLAAKEQTENTCRTAVGRARYDLIEWEQSLTNSRKSTGDSYKVVINGSQNVVQQGLVGSHVSVVINATSLEALSRALDTVDRALQDRRGEIPPDTALQLSSLISEVRSEKDNPSRNDLRFTSLLQGLAVAIQTVPALQPCYEAVHHALMLMGLGT